MGKSIKSSSFALPSAGASVLATTPLDSMSLRLVIPWRVALQQSPPPLHQPAGTLQQLRGGSQVAIRCSFKTTLTRGLTSGAHRTYHSSRGLMRSVPSADFDD